MPTLTPPPPKPPPSLGPAGKKLWTEITQKYELRDDELHCLEIASRTVDVLARVDLAIAKDGVLVEGPKGRSIPNPLLEERRREARVALAALSGIGLKTVNLDSPHGDRSAAGRMLVETRTDRRGSPRLREGAVENG